MVKFPYGSLSSSSTITALTNGTMRFVLKSPSSFTGQIFWWTAGGGDDWQLYFANTGSNVIAFQTASPKSEDGDIWTVPANTSTWYDFAIKHNFAAGATAPTVYLNGTKQTVTHYQTKTSLSSLGNAVWTLGYTTGGDYEIGGFAWWSSQLSDADMETLTRAKIYNMPLYISPSTLVQFTPLDDIPVGEYTGTNSNITPDADVTNTFHAGNYTNINADDSNYLVADKSDDNETYTCSLSTFTIPSGFSVYATTQSIKGNNDDTATPTASITVGGVEQTVWGQAFTASDATFTRTDYQSLSQSDVNGMQMSLKTPTMGKNDQFNWNLCFVKVSYRRHSLVNLKGSSEFRAIGTCVLSTGLAGSGGYS